MSLFEQCYLRLTTREHALSLLKRFKLEYGKGDREEDKIVLELLDGRREEMYWEGVPDKVHALAVQRAQKAQRANGDPVQEDDQDGVSMGTGGAQATEKTPEAMNETIKIQARVHGFMNVNQPPTST
jgi:hypothetical protein